ncbi:hypothetical protein L1280_000681 [Deinococcus sp. HSC-46F16]|uniref:hypothetical protein n=1 Tax=Deinococcus sp. HSC-46F16 TaxID=2910968 RepID=UPI00209C6EC3|nr:hypothetical protein [Deinococcus sp. HSC-46F16]MCP2013553.1 hypothetical protein [Deinococcus sp. HSC-46F16]
MSELASVLIHALSFLGGRLFYFLGGLLMAYLGWDSGQPIVIGLGGVLIVAGVVSVWRRAQRTGP